MFIYLLRTYICETITNKQKQNKMKLTIEQKEANKEARKEALRIKKNQLIIDTQKNQKPVKDIKINIEWSKQGNPMCIAWVTYLDNSSNYFTAKAGGYGYCKESTVIAEIFNYCLAYKLYEMHEVEKKPYGINFYNNKYYFAGAVGTSCYYNISEFIGGTFEKIASGKTFDAFTFKMN